MSEKSNNNYFDEKLIDSKIEEIEDFVKEENIDTYEYLVNELILRKSK